VDLAEHFSALSGATSVDGVPDAWFRTHAPTFGEHVVLSGDREHAFRFFAHDSYDEGLARAILAAVRERGDELAAPPEQPLAVVTGFRPPGFAFDTLVSIGPGVHRYDVDEADVHAVTRAVIPAYRCEFSGFETEDQVAHRHNRAAGVQGTRWNREPNPYLRMRHRTDSGREIPERGFVNPSRLLTEFARLPGRDGGFVEFENWQRRVWTVTWQGTHVLTENGGDAGPLGLDDLIEFAKDVLLAPNRSAGESAFTVSGR
jgi:hypothetical protein